MTYVADDNMGQKNRYFTCKKLDILDVQKYGPSMVRTFDT